MLIKNQIELKNIIETFFTDGSLVINSFVFRQFHSVESVHRENLLRTLYADEFTANYSFESKENSTAEIINFFMNASPEKQKAHFMVFDKDNHFLGRCNLRVVDGKICFGIALQPSVQNKGYGQAILKALFTLCFDVLKLEQNIYGSTMSYNIRSQMTMQKIGMRPDGIISKDLNLALDTKWLKYEITPLQFLTNNTAASTHPDSRKLSDVILEDYLKSRKQEARVKYNATQYERARFFMKQERRKFAFTQLKRKIMEKVEHKDLDEPQLAMIKRP
ncbi:MAG: GNAT family protein [Legionellaceae bacterium]|nr:GNAT family protein [Legionellaceae bacterium]